MGVIQGDIQTTLDADRVRAAGAAAVQIETHGACHLDAAMVAGAMTELPLAELDLVVIENVGNLVCPTGYDLGEDEKVAVLSVPEGDEKPVKYPALFIRAAAVVINKTDLLPYTNFSMDRAVADLRRLNARAAVFPLSCRTGDGLDAWCAYLRRRRGGQAVT
jgi:hydrogenase nickel incorporation protein HypB